MNLVLVKHGRKQAVDGCPEARWPLDPAEFRRVERLRKTLERRGLKARFILTSRHLHAEDTARRLAVALTRQIVLVQGLTPETDERHFTLANMLDEAAAEGVVWEGCDTLMLVGHEARLSTLAGRLVGTYVEPLEHLEALVVNLKFDLGGRLQP
jgi:phosphohistidine phosphatase SixA